MQDHGKFFSDAEQKAREDEILPPESFGFYNALFNYQTTRYDEYRTLIPGMSINASAEPPILVADSIGLSADVSRALSAGLNALLDLVGRFNSGLNFDGLRGPAAGELAESVLGALLTRDMELLKQHSSDAKIGFEEYVFIITNWFKPFLAAVAETFKDRIKDDEWIRPDCPVCGYFPDIARITGAGEGRRYLHCALCETEWAFKRVSCTICENSDIETLGYFAEEGTTRHRIDYCDACKGYLKTVILPKFQEPGTIDLAVENVLTAGLDAAALEKGYSRP